MANYSLVVDTQFKARNFEDLIKPYAMYTEEYRALEDAIADLATKADVWAGLANELTDPVAYAQYTNYANALKQQAAVMADRGLDPSSRQAMLNLKKRYSSEIVPIEQAYTTRKAQAEEQRKALLQNPTLMLSRRADSTSLDRYMENPELGYDSYSGALLTQLTSQAAAAIAKELRDYGRGKPLDGFTKTWLQEHGYTAAEVAFAINHPNDPRASNVLNTIVETVMTDSGMANWADNRTMNQAYNYARQGLWQAVGQTQIGTYTDDAAKLNYEYGLKANSASKSGSGTKEKDPESIDRTSYFFESGKKHIPEMLDLNGKLKDSPYTSGEASKQNLASELFKDGKFKRPDRGTSAYNTKNVNAIAYYDKIKDILMDHGYTLSDIDVMSRDDVESTLASIQAQNSEDLLGTGLYRYATDESTAKFVASLMRSRGLRPKELVSIKEGVPQYGRSDWFTLDDGSTMDILYDATRDLVLFLANNGSYKVLPEGMLSTDTRTLMTQTALKKKESKEILDYYLDKLSSNPDSLTERDKILYLKAYESFLECDSILGNLGNEIGLYVGKDNRNS